MQLEGLRVQLNEASHAAKVNEEQLAGENASLLAELTAVRQEVRGLYRCMVYV
jgi:hypothetical protein